MIKNKLIYSTLIISAFLTGMGTPLSKKDLTEPQEKHASLFARLQELEEACNQNAKQMKFLEKEVANQKWWNKALLVSGTAVAIGLYALHHLANAQQTAQTLPIADDKLNKQEVTSENGSITWGNGRYVLIDGGIGIYADLD